MRGFNGDRTLLMAFLVVHLTVMVGVLGFVLGWWSLGGGGSSQADEELGVADAGIDDPTVTPPSGSLFLVTATPAASDRPTVTASPEATSAGPASPVRPPAPTATPRTETASPVTSTAGFDGRWRIVDVVTSGSNAGQSYSFDVVLTQNGNQISGGNSGIHMTGVARGDTATVSYVQPALGYSGTFVWTMVSSHQATGSFTNSYPNAGTSTLQRLQ